MTALSMPGDREKALAAGFDGFMTKPITPETFVQQIESFLPANPQASNS
jgi:CheY-like chemotaxis protein